MTLSARCGAHSARETRESAAASPRAGSHLGRSLTGRGNAQTGDTNGKWRCEPHKGAHNSPSTTGSGCRLLLAALLGGQVQQSLEALQARPATSRRHIDAGRVQALVASPQSGLHWPVEFECAHWASSAAQERQGPAFRVSGGQGQGQGSESVEAREARFERGKLLSAGLRPGQIKPWPAVRSSTTAACVHSCSASQLCVDTNVRQ